MLRNVKQSFLIEDAKLGEDTVDRTAESRGTVFASERAGDPLLKKRSSHAVARFEGGDTVAGRKDFAAAIGRNDGWLRRVARVTAGDHCQVTIVERNSFNRDQDLSGAGLRNVHLIEHQRVNTGRAGRVSDGSNRLRCARRFLAGQMGGTHDEIKCIASGPKAGVVL